MKTPSMRHVFSFQKKAMKKKKKDSEALTTPLRTPEMWQKLRSSQNEAVCFMCTDEPLQVQEYNFWKIIANKFPYDEIAHTHHMLVPKRHIANEKDFNAEEKQELAVIFRECDHSGVYDSITRNFTTSQTHPSHVHYHLMFYKWR